MENALALARRGLGRVSPNPAVGCVLVREDLGGRIVGRGWTQPGGRPHAETEAIRRAGTLAKGATAYVTLEPCSHHGETPPCCDALINAGISRVIVAIEDPDSRVSGRGVQRLKDVGIDVISGVLAEEAHDLNIGFLLNVTQKRPFITWKTATTMDGRIATKSGDSQWITGALARQYGHLLRAENDAIMTGIETVLSDQPSLTCRLPGMECRSPIRIVLDSQLRLPTDSMLAQTAKETPTWVYTLKENSSAQRPELESLGVIVIDAKAGDGGRVSTEWASTDMAEKGITRVLLESGGTLAASFMKAELIDRIAWFRAPILVGGDGRSALASVNIEKLIQSPAFTRRSTCVMGADTLDIMDRTPAA